MKVLPVIQPITVVMPDIRQGDIFNESWKAKVIVRILSNWAGRSESELLIEVSWQVKRRMPSLWIWTEDKSAKSFKVEMDGPLRSSYKQRREALIDKRLSI